MRGQPDMREVSLALGANIQTLAPALIGTAPSSKGRTEWRFRNHGSLAVVIAGQDRGLWHDHEAGIGGDALDLVAVTRDCSRKEAWRWGLNWLGQVPVELPAQKAHQRSQEPSSHHGLDMARTIWREAVTPSGTPVEAYLRSRGLALPRDKQDESAASIRMRIGSCCVVEGRRA